MKKPFYAMFGIDMETDVGSYTPFYEGVRNGTPLLLDLFDQQDIAATFYFAGICAQENPEITRRVANSRHEIGCHSLYHETVGDELFPLPGVTPLLKDEVAPRIRLATEWIESVCGVHPTSFRCPRCWGSTAVVNALETLGYTSDCSYPMYFHKDQLYPYHPSRTDWTQAGDSSVVEIPLFADMTMESHDPKFGRDRDQWPLFRTRGAAHVLNMIDRFHNLCDAKDIPCVIAFYMHPWEFWPMLERYAVGSAEILPNPFLIENCGKKALSELDALITGLKTRGASIVTAYELSRSFG